jgi:hypothetical protein
MNKRQEAVGRLIARSSLGSPAARKLRAKTSTSQRSQILSKAAARQARDPHPRVTKRHT